MNSRVIVSRCVAIAAYLITAACATSQPVLRQDFENGTEGWTGFGTNSKVSATNNAADVKAGKGALQYSYSIAKGEMNAMILPTPPPKLAKMKSLKLWIKTDQTTTVIVSLQEHDAGRYMASFLAPKDTWQKVELSTGDFNLLMGPNDPKDPDGKLDLDQVDSISIADLGQFFAQADAPIADLFSIKMGAHTLFLDDVEVSEEAVPGSYATTESGVTIETFAHPQLSWIGVGGMNLSAVGGKSWAQKVLQVDYKQAPMKFSGVVRPIRPGSLAGMKTLSLTVASAKACKLAIQVEEPDGGKYNTLVDVPGGSVPTPIKIPFSELGATEDSKDNNGKLDVDRIHQLIIIDVYGMVAMAEGENTLWLGNVAATK